MEYLLEDRIDSRLPNDRFAENRIIRDNTRVPSYHNGVKFNILH